MVHVHGRRAQQLALGTRGLDPGGLVAVPIDVGKRQAAALVCDFAGELLARPFEVRDEPGRGRGAGSAGGGGDRRSAGRAGPGRDLGGRAYHQPLLAEGGCQLAGRWWEVNPAQVAAQRGVAGRRGVKTDALDLVAISDLLRAGQGAQLRPPGPGHGLGWQRGWRTASGG